VAGREGGGVVIDTATNAVIDSFPTNAGLDIALTPDGTRAYVPNFDSEVRVIETATNTLVAEIPFGGPALFVAVTPDGTGAYVTEAGSSSFIGTVVVIDTATNMVVDEIEGFKCPQAIAIAPPQFPRSKDDCKNGGYQRFGPPEFRNQGQCLKYVKEHSN
jgi:YVTN family beta-propeller protein